MMAVAAMVAVMAIIGVAMIWRIMERATGVAGTEGAFAFDPHGDSLYVLRAGEERPVELARVTGEREEVLWRGRGKGSLVAAGPSGVLFSICTDAEVYPCPGKTFFMPHDGPVREIAPRRAASSAAFHDGRVFFVASGVLVVAGDGEPTAVSYGTGCVRSASSVVADDTGVFWLDIGTVWALRPGEAPHELHGGVRFAQELVLADGDLYVLEGRALPHQPASGRVLRIPTDGGAPEVLVDGLRDPTRLVVIRDKLVVRAEELDGDGVAQPALFVAPRAGGSIRRWMALPPLSSGIASDGQRILVGGDRVAVLDLPE